jgi:hypothetical protein
MKFARGRIALGQCTRCGSVARLKSLVADEYKPGLLVHTWCKDEKHPADQPFNASEGIALKRPAPDLDDDSAGAGDDIATAMGFSNHFGGGT